uniref:Cytochrome P450 n=1 Tax=Salvator merianae TaxID=96440 RepID=A0A8D0DU95_SALMN
MDLLGSTTALVAICLVMLMVWATRGKRKNCPPGPMSLPLLGSLPLLKGQDTVSCLKELSKKYGPVFQVNFGSNPAVILCGYEVVKKALIDRGDEFLDRGKFPSSEKASRGLGVIMSNGERWLQLRRFSLMTLRNFGMGKKSNEEHAQEEAQRLVQELQAKKGEPFNPTTLFNSATANVISQILLGERFDYHDPKYLRVLYLLTEAFRLESSFAGQLYNLLPRIMEYLPGPHQTFFKYVYEIQAFMDQKVEEHERTLEPSNPRDFIDDFLLKMEQEKKNPQTEYTRENLMMTVFDLFFAGTETTSTTLRYILMVLVEHPEVQAKIREEIDEVIGRERPPALKDRLAMPYTEAVIQEAQRFMDFVPLGIVRMAKADLEFEGFTIPKGTTVITMLSSALHDPKHFKNPYHFDPNHFLDEKGAFKKNAAAIPFSAGRRNCLGEGLARLELFLYVTTILQNFHLKRPPGVDKIDLTPDVSGFANIPRQVELCFAPR